MDGELRRLEGRKRMRSKQEKLQEEEHASISDILMKELLLDLLQLAYIYINNLIYDCICGCQDTSNEVDCPWMLPHDHGPVGAPLSLALPGILAHWKISYCIVLCLNC